MKILRLHVDNFGTLQNYSMELTDGLNLLCQENGWGKSTLAVFIKAMLYGLPATTKQNLDLNERKKYAPWQGGAFGGSMEFQTKKGSFRVERYFGAKESGDSFALFDLDTKLPSTAYSAALGEELFGINAEGFERSTYLSQREISEKSSTASIASRLGSLLDAVDDIDTYEDALSALEKRRKFYVLTGGRGAIAEAEQEKAALERELERLQMRLQAQHDQEARLKEREKELGALKLEAEAIRQQQKKASLARERAALQEQKARMTSALNEKKNRRAQIEHDFMGSPPSEAECAKARALYEQLSAARTKASALEAPIPDAAQLEQLRGKFANGIPSAEQLDSLDALVREQMTLTSRKDAIKEEQKELPAVHTDRLPTQKTLDRAFELLRASEDAHKEGARLTLRAAEKRPTSPLAIFSVLFLVIGVLLLVLCAVFAKTAIFLPSLIGGILCVIVGGICFFAHSSHRKKQTEQQNALMQSAQKLKKTEDSARAEIRNLLLAYGVTPSEDLARDVSNFSLLVSKVRSQADRASQLAEELLGVNARIEDVSARLLERLTLYRDADARTDSPITVLNDLRRDVAQYHALARAAFRQKEELAAAVADKEDLQRELLPFLKRYRPEAPTHVSERIRVIEESVREYIRLGAEIAKASEELRQFVLDKHLDDRHEEATDSYAALEAQEKSLLVKIHDLQEEIATQKGLLERLEQDTDTIPYVKERLAHEDERLAEYNRNYKTIQETQRLLQEAKDALSVRYLGSMQASFEGFLRDLVGEDAPQSVMNTKFEVQLRDGGKTHTMESFSQGWRDAVRFCIRLSLADALYADGEAPLLLLDDPFVNLDDRRLTAAKSMLSTLAQRYQIIYMVCREENRV